MKNRFLPRLALVFLLTAGAAGAIQLKDALGRWTGRHQETRDGLGTYTRVLIKGKRLAGGGVLLTEKGESAELGHYVIKYHFYKKGRFAQSTIVAGMIVQTATGTWEKTSGKIIVRGTGGNDLGTHSFHGALRKGANGQIKYSGKSGDVLVKIDGRPL